MLSLHPVVSERVKEHAMAALPDSKYHLREQQADALLAPVHASLSEMERRVQHYLVHMRLGDADTEALTVAHDVLADAAAQLARIVRQSQEIARG
jgi:hypothetical protein